MCPNDFFDVARLVNKPNNLSKIGHTTGPRFGRAVAIAQFAQGLQDGTRRSYKALVSTITIMLPNRANAHAKTRAQMHDEIT